MACCWSVTCFFGTVCTLIGLTSLVQFALGVYATFVQPDLMAINRLIKTDQFDSYLVYVLLAFIGLGFTSLILSLLSIYGVIQRHRSLSLFVTILWVSSFRRTAFVARVSLSLSL
jgi:hypothetical protein